MPTQLVDRFGAPDLATGRVSPRKRKSPLRSRSARIPSALSIAVHRSAADGEVREVVPQIATAGEASGHGKAFSFMEVEDDPEPDSDLNLADMSLEPRRR